MADEVAVDEITWESMDEEVREIPGSLPLVRAPRWIRFPGPDFYEEARDLYPGLPPWGKLEHDEYGGATLYLDRHGSPTEPPDGS